MDFINITKENLPKEHLCCIIRTKKPHEGIEAKKRWLSERLEEGHVFRKLSDKKAVVFIEYAPVETAWVPIEGKNFYYIYCLWVTGEYKGKGYGKALLEYCIDDAKDKGLCGVCLLGSKKQKAWLTDTEFAKRQGFITADTTENGYELLALSFDGNLPRFCENAKKMRIESETLTVYYSHQCPYTLKGIEMIANQCTQMGVPFELIEVDSLQKAKGLPCVFNNWALFYKGKFESVNLLLDTGKLKKYLEK